MSAPTQQERSHLRWSKWASMATVATAIIAFIGLYALIKPEKPATVINDRRRTDHTTIIQPLPGSNKEEAKPDRARPQKQRPAPVISPHQPENLWDNRLAGRIRQILSGKGYKSAAAFSGSLLLSEPEAVREKSLRYTLTLMIDFFVPPSKQSCGRLIYRKAVETDARDTRDRIIDQGLDGFDGIYGQLEKETALPACIIP